MAETVPCLQCMPTLPSLPDMWRRLLPSRLELPPYLPRKLYARRRLVLCRPTVEGLPPCHPSLCQTVEGGATCHRKPNDPDRQTVLFRRETGMWAGWTGRPGLPWWAAGRQWHGRFGQAGGDCNRRGTKGMAWPWQEDGPPWQTGRRAGIEKACPGNEGRANTRRRACGRRTGGTERRAGKHPALPACRAATAGGDNTGELVTKGWRR